MEPPSYNEAKDDYDMELLKADKRINELEKANKELITKNKLLQSKEIKVNDISSAIVKKDKEIYKLKCGLGIFTTRLNETMIPKSYMRISEKFPHLTLKEIIEFEKLVKENGGSIKVHCGKFRLTERMSESNPHTHSRAACNMKEITWDCCHSFQYPRKRLYLNNSEAYRKNKDLCIAPPNGSSYKTGGAKDLRNRNPNGECDFPETFYLYEKDEKTKNINEVKVKDTCEAISHNISLLEETIKQSLSEIDKLTKIKETLELLN